MKCPRPNNMIFHDEAMGPYPTVMLRRKLILQHESRTMVIIEIGSAVFVDKPMGSVNDDDVVEIHGPVRSVQAFLRVPWKLWMGTTLEIKDSIRLQYIIA